MNDVAAGQCKTASVRDGWPFFSRPHKLVSCRDEGGKLGFVVEQAGESGLSGLSDVPSAAINHFQWGI